MLYVEHGIIAIAEVFKDANANQSCFVSELAELVRFSSISGQLAHAAGIRWLGTCCC